MSHNSTDRLAEAMKPIYLRFQAHEQARQLLQVWDNFEQLDPDTKVLVFSEVEDLVGQVTDVHETRAALEALARTGSHD